MEICLIFSILLNGIFLKIFLEKELPLNGLENISEKMNSYEMTSKGLPQIFEGFCCFISKKYLQAILKFKEGMHTLVKFINILLSLTGFFNSRYLL